MDHKAGATVQRGRWADYWRRDAIRFGTAAITPTQDLWQFGWGRLSHRASVGLVACVSGVAFMLSTMQVMLHAGWSPGWVGVVVVLAWGPWLLGCLALIHLFRAWFLVRAAGESDAEFVQHVGEDADLALSVRQALGEVYGVPARLIRSSDTGYDLSRWMESPTTDEFCRAFLRAWGSGRSPATIADRLGVVPAAETVAGVVRRLSGRRS
jgi:hypothetical protein